MPSNRIWIDYDEDADVLYVSFQKPQHADDSEWDYRGWCEEIWRIRAIYDTGVII
jgi:hypothetical protein